MSLTRQRETRISGGSCNALNISQTTEELHVYPSVKDQQSNNHLTADVVCVADIPNVVKQKKLNHY